MNECVNKVVEVYGDNVSRISVKQYMESLMRNSNVLILSDSGCSVRSSVLLNITSGKNFFHSVSSDMVSLCWFVRNFAKIANITGLLSTKD